MKNYFFQQKHTLHKNIFPLPGRLTLLKNLFFLFPLLLHLLIEKLQFFVI